VRRGNFSKFNKYKPQTTKLEHLSEEELYQRFVTLVGAIILVIVVLVGGLLFFGPKIGSFFGLISVNRNPKSIKDTMSPPAPTFTDPPVATKDDKITLNGVAEPGTTIRLFVNGPEKQTTLVDLAGVFIFTDIELNQGRNTIFAKSVDSNNNESDTSVTLTIELDKDSPDIKIESPTDGSIVKNLDKRILIKGSINEKATIKINDRLAVQKSDLTFDFLLGVDEGDVKVTIEAIDLAGNKKEEILNLKYEEKSN